MRAARSSPSRAAARRRSTAASSASSAAISRRVAASMSADALAPSDAWEERSFMQNPKARFQAAAGHAKGTTRQAFSARNLRGKRERRNAGHKLCTAKAPIPLPGLGLPSRRCYPPLPQIRAPIASSPGAARFKNLTSTDHPMASVDHTRMANAIRGLAMDAVEKAKSGHPGLPMGAADIATVLWTQFLKYDAADPTWPDRDRFILSAGHGSMPLYALLYLTGNKDMTLEQLKHFRQLGSLTPGHPENFHTPGIETTTGPLGQGIATSIGFAVAEKMLAAEFGKKIVNHHTYVLCSDGDLMEGVSQEAIAMAGHWKLNKLIVLYDDNGISIDGPTSLADSVDQIGSA